MVISEADVLYGIADLITVHDGAGDYVWASPNILDHLGYKPEEMVGKSAYELFHPADVNPTRVSHVEVLTDGSSIARVRLRALHGEHFWYECRSRKCEINGQVMLVVTSRRVCSSVNREKELSLAVLSDELTGLGSRRKFNSDMQAVVKAAKRGRAPTLLMLDLDSFKAVNDTHGHDAGDEVLRKVAGAIAETIREVDTAYRVGGDEFFVILDGCPLMAGVRIAERIRATVEELELETHCSIGAATITDPGTASVEFLVQDIKLRADKALNQAKNSGKNCIRVGTATTGGSDETHSYRGKGADIV